MTTIRILFLLAMLAHLLCGYCDCLLTYLPGGRFRVEDLNDNDKLAKTFEGADPRSSLLSVLLGCLALFLVFAPFRVAGTGNWASAIMFLGLLLLV